MQINQGGKPEVTNEKDKQVVSQKTFIVSYTFFLLEVFIYYPKKRYFLFVGHVLSENLFTFLNTMA